MPKLLLQCHYGFTSYWEYDTFQIELQQQLESGQLVDVGLRKPPGRYGAERMFVCHDSSKARWLSSPDNAWRGYFLPAENALAYQRSLRRRDLRIRLFVALLLLAVGYFVYRTSASF